VHPCPRCSRHIREEARCPFCRAQRPRRALVLMGALLVTPIEARAQDKPMYGGPPPPRDGCEDDDHACVLGRLQLAYQLAPSPQVLSNLARTLEAMGRPAEAMGYLAEMKMRCAAEQDDESVACDAVDARVAALQPLVVTLELDVRGELAELTVGDRRVPAIARTVFAEPGEIILRATWKDAAPSEHRVKGRAGESLELVLAPEPAAEPGPPPDPTVVVAPHPSEAGCACSEGPGSGSALAALAFGAATALARTRRRPR
jgi:hypothetical protein